MDDQLIYKKLLSVIDFNFQNISFDKIKNQETTNQNLSLTILRLDKVHEQVSGNKLFKLYYFIKECLKSSDKTLLTFGGAYSNHLAATAFLCNKKGIRSIGIVRGEEPKNLSHTLAQCRVWGMKLKFLSREAYHNCENNPDPKIITPPPSERLIPKCKLGTSIWAYLLVKKFEYQQPIHRTLAELQGNGLSLAKGTVTDGLQKLLPLFI